VILFLLTGNFDLTFAKTPDSDQCHRQLPWKTVHRVNSNAIPICQYVINMFVCLPTRRGQSVLYESFSAELLVN